MQFGDEIKQHLAKKQIEIIGRRYCTGCQKMQRPDGGEERKRPGHARWICAACCTRARQGIVVRMT